MSGLDIETAITIKVTESDLLRSNYNALLQVLKVKYLPDEGEGASYISQCLFVCKEQTNSENRWKARAKELEDLLLEHETTMDLRVRAIFNTNESRPFGYQTFVFSSTKTCD